MKNIFIRGRETGAPRRRVLRSARNRALMAIGGAAIFAAAAFGAYALVRSGLPARVAAKTQALAIDVSGRLGLQIADIIVIGREETANEELLKAIAAGRGTPIFAFDPVAARARIEKLSWVRRASVERRLPSTIVVRIGERTPLALWQNKGAFALIDTEGHVIMRAGLERFARLPIVVGEDAPAHAGSLLRLLAEEPDLMKRMKAAVRVAGRRWNVILEGNIDVRLPEDDLAGAWKRLADYERAHGVLERNVRVLDLRQPDRLIVRTEPPPPAKRTRTTDNET